MKLILIYKTVFQLILLILFTACKNSQITQDKPNIILIYADDFGKGLLGHEGQQIIKTPNIDKLAEEGLRFQNAYSCMLCAPARASLLTGLHDCHSPKFEISNAGIYKKISTGEYTHSEVESLINERLSLVPEEMVFLGGVAKKAGYTTGIFGKWKQTRGSREIHGKDYIFEFGWDEF